MNPVISLMIMLGCGLFWVGVFCFVKNQSDLPSKPTPAISVEYRMDGLEMRLQRLEDSVQALREVRK